MYDKLKRAIIKSVISRYSVYLIQVISLAIYSRLFTPEEFGILAAIQVFSTFFLMMGEIGIGPAIINFKKLSNKNRDGLFSLTVVIGFIIGFIFYIFSYGLNYFYDRNDYQYLSIFVCISIVFSCCNILPNAFLVRERFFYKLAFTDIVSEVVAFFVIILLWAHEYPLYALASRPCVVAIFRFLINFNLNLKNIEFGKPLFKWYPSSIKPILSFSIYQFSFNVLNYFSRNLDNILVGKYFGLTPLGIYDKSYMLMKYPLQLVSFAIGPALQPILSTECKSFEDVKKVHDKLIYNLSFLSSLIGFCVYSNADLIVKIMLGEQWGDVSKILSILSFSIPIQILLSTSGSVFQALNKTKLMFYSGVFSAATNIIGMVLSVIFGDIYTLSFVLVITFTINFFQCYYLMYTKIFNKSLFGFIKLISPSFITAFVMINIYKYYYLAYEVKINAYYNSVFIFLLSVAVFYFSYYFWSKNKIYKRVLNVS